MFTETIAACGCIGRFFRLLCWMLVSHDVIKWRYETSAHQIFVKLSGNVCLSLLLFVSKYEVILKIFRRDISLLWFWLVYWHPDNKNPGMTLATLKMKCFTYRGKRMSKWLEQFSYEKLHLLEKLRTLQSSFFKHV